MRKENVYISKREGIVMRNINGYSVMLQAHRGDSVRCPENTMAAFRSAVAHCFDLIELDPKFTRDNQCVVLHDRSIARTGRDAEGRSVDAPIAALTLEEARAYEFGSWFGAQFAGEPLPLLEDVLRFAHEERIAVKLDNVIESFTSGQTAILLDVVERSGAADVIGFTCTRPDYAAAVTARFPEATIHYDGAPDEDSLRAITGVLKENPLVVWLRYPGSQTAWCKTPPASEERAALVRRMGAKVGLWIIDDENQAADACARFAPDIIETAGFIRPDAQTR